MIDLEKIVTKTIANGMIYYHACAVDVNRALYIVGLRTDEEAEKVGKKHMMSVYKILVRIHGKERVDKYLNNC